VTGHRFTSLKTTWTKVAYSSKTSLRHMTILNKWHSCRSHPSLRVLHFVIGEYMQLKVTALGCRSLAWRSRQVSWKSMNWLKI
jgi:hypothetical protein